MSLEEYESHLRRELADLHREYSRMAEPIVKRLVELQSLKPMPPMIISIEQARSLGIATCSADAVTDGKGATPASETEGAGQ